MNQAGGHSVKLNNKIIISSWMGDPMGMSGLWVIGCVRHMGHGYEIYVLFPVHKIYF